MAAARRVLATQVASQGCEILRAAGRASARSGTATASRRRGAAAFQGAQHDARRRRAGSLRATAARRRVGQGEGEAAAAALVLFDKTAAEKMLTDVPRGGGWTTQRRRCAEVNGSLVADLAVGTVGLIHRFVPCQTLQRDASVEWLQLQTDLLGLFGRGVRRRSAEAPGAFVEWKPRRWWTCRRGRCGGRASASCCRIDSAHEAEAFLHAHRGAERRAARPGRRQPRDDARQGPRAPRSRAARPRRRRHARRPPPRTAHDLARRRRDARRRRRRGGAARHRLCQRARREAPEARRRRAAGGSRRRRSAQLPPTPRSAGRRRAVAGQRA